MLMNFEQTQGRTSPKQYAPSTFQRWGHNEQKMTNNTNLDRVNIIAHTKFGHILLISSKDVERKRNSDISKGP